MKLSYLITCHNESRTLLGCLTNLFHHKDDEDEIVILDDFSDDPKTQEILKVAKATGARVFLHALDKNYGVHKNFGNEQCTGDWIFQIDGDEIPNPNLIINIKSIIEANPAIELFFVARINDYIGVTQKDAQTWGWRLTPHESIVHEKIIDADSEEYIFLKKNGYILEETNI